MLLNVLDYFIFFFLIFILYIFIKKTEALKVVIGILILYLLFYFADFIGLEKTSSFLNLGTQTLIFGTILIFSPELRAFFKKISGLSKKPKRPTNANLKILEDALFDLSKKKHGALIIMDDDGAVSSISENSVYIDAKLSASLIGTIFHPNTPLHDGAVLINKGRIQYAGSKLPLRARKRENFGTLGTRHMVAIETSETHDTIVFVVSEETGTIRIASKKGLYYVSSREDFRQYFQQKNEV